MNQYKTSDVDALTPVFHQYYSALCFFAERLIESQSVAEEIVDDTFLKLWKSRSDFDNHLSIKAFLYICVKNACFNYLTKQRRLVKKDQMLLHHFSSWTEESIENEIIRTEVIREVYLAIELLLPPQCKKIFRLSFEEGLSNSQIAEKLNISIHTVKNQKHIALTVLRKKFASNTLILGFLLIL
jgi:RNA polymerase sigma-70 factor (ECF subfamily)